ncbi:hypothetical protein SAMN04489761_0091 [Tenacibaculum sp. MAR_2009_124]|uniref:hypothetical protein n=1 Tax=Tenacibaculum sp. MAR_2009_124 TaxID=1250059 RepID=UPI00089AC4FB|nr:hypothetical protein [Tenacibaculum sp. MAR_2009_124]SEB35770.1 hypothetical protein SAMN04489761_0091 [Tenacibaculum sp. MAR_2009_124]
MIRPNSGKPKIMEFTSFKKREEISDEELIQSVRQFENSFLAKEEGILFHCLVRNSNNDYANVLFTENMESMKELEKAAANSEEATYFFSLVEPGSVQMNFQTIEKNDFIIPDSFSCVEYGSFSLKDVSNFENLLSVSETIEKEYLSKSENTKAHFIGKITENHFSEVTFGSTLDKTKEICSGYTQNEYCIPMLEMADADSMKLDFWHLIN